MKTEFDYIVIGGGSAGCAVAGELARLGGDSVALLEAGPSNRSLFVRTPFLLMFMMGSKKRDWCLRSAPQESLDERELSVPRGKMLGGSGSINSMVWFRGRRDDFDAWELPGWSSGELWPLFGEVESRMTPSRLPDPHPLAEAFGSVFPGSPEDAPTPEKESSGVFHVNMRNGRRWSPADAFLQEKHSTRPVNIHTGTRVARVFFEGDTATGVEMIDGVKIKARKGVVLSAGAIESPAILMRSGIGPADQLQSLDIPVRHDSARVGQNLHDHPAIGLHHAGRHSGYGLTLRQAPQWLLSPFRYLLTGKGPFSSNIVEAGAFFNARGEDAKPDVQVHFIPYMMGWQGKTLVTGSGYFADVCVSRPRSRGSLKLKSADPLQAPSIDLGVLRDPHDLDTLVAAFKRLRSELQNAPFGSRKAPEAFPGVQAQSDDEIRKHIIERLGTAYHPVGTLSMGNDDQPVTPDLRVRGARNLWVADASVMPRITSANTNAPSILIGYRAARFINQKTG